MMKQPPQSAVSGINLTRTAMLLCVLLDIGLIFIATRDADSPLRMPGGMTYVVPRCFQWVVDLAWRSHRPAMSRRLSIEK